MTEQAVDPKKFYNETMPEKFGDDYEQVRWHKDGIREAQYKMTATAVTKHLLSLRDLDPRRVLEIGPGVGTWTKLLLDRYPKASFDLVDISGEMLKRAAIALPGDRHIHFIEHDITTWDPEGSYHIAMSIRAIEYIHGKAQFVKTMYDALAPGGVGFIVTKTPHYDRQRLLGIPFSYFHKWQVTPEVLVALLEDAGFTDIAVYPAAMSFPVIHFGWTNRLLYGVIGRGPLNKFSEFFAESYCVRFRKPGA